MFIWDISFGIHADMPVWPGDPKPVYRTMLAVASGDDVTTGLLCIGTHNGTHVDAPAHLFRDGATVDQLDLSALIGPAEVVDCGVAPFVTAATLEARLTPDCRRVLLKVPEPVLRNGDFASSASLAPEAAQGLVEHHIQLVGISGPTVDSFTSCQMDIHRELLSAGIVIVENLRLDDVPEGRYYFACLPLAIIGADGAPARAVLWSDM